MVFMEVRNLSDNNNHNHNNNPRDNFSNKSADSFDSDVNGSLNIKSSTEAENRKRQRDESHRRALESDCVVMADESLSAVWVSEKPKASEPAETPAKAEKSKTPAEPSKGGTAERAYPSPDKASNNYQQKPASPSEEEYAQRPAVLASQKKKAQEAAERARKLTEQKLKKEEKMKKRHKRNGVFKGFSMFLLIALAVLVIGGLVLTLSVIARADKIDTEDIYSNISENSVMYDSAGNVMENVMSSQLRTNIPYDEMSDTIISAFISIEDKTFWTHHGFNFIRIGGAILESVTKGGSISGTSTITQQLARNIFLADSKSERTLTRKLTEAYYTTILERHLTKQQIIEAYLNTIYLGFNTYGIEAAAKTYFGKTANELTLAEASALACIPKNPSGYALIKRYYPGEVDADSSNIIDAQGEFVLVYNDAFKARQKYVLEFMTEEGYITKEQADEAYAYDIRQSINPPENLESNSQTSSYYTDYAKDEAVSILMEKLKINNAEATQMLYNGGLSIHTALDTNIQAIVEEEFSKPSNFPSAQGTRKDSKGNMISSVGNIMLYNYNTYYNSDNSFTLEEGEFAYDSYGNLTLYKDNRINFYKSSADNNNNVSISFRPTYQYQDGLLYISSSGQVNVDSVYKTLEPNGNLVISKEFLDAYPDAFVSSGSTVTISPNYMTISESVVQPQGSMVIMDQSNGCIKAMVGGRNITGSKLYNRADSSRQPGSSIKPLGVYLPAILEGFTGGTIVADSPHHEINGKPWPKNSNGHYSGSVTMRRAVQSSINAAAVNVLDEVGIDTSFEFVESLGITTLVKDDKALAALGLGGLTNGLKPIESCAAYSTIANYGVYNKPTTITQILDRNGDVIYDISDNKPKTVFDDGTAFLMTDILRTAVSNGTGSRARIYSNNATIPVAGKTGTTTANYDAWFCGFTPYYTAVVWVGNDYNIQLSNGSGAAASLWSNVMTKVHQGLAPKTFVQPDSVGKQGGEYYVIGRDRAANQKAAPMDMVSICLESGLLAVEGCPETKSVYADEAPKEYCSIHSSLSSEDPDANGDGENPSGDPNANPGGSQTQPSTEPKPNNPSQPSNPGGSSQPEGGFIPMP